MATAKKTVSKLARRAKKVKTRARGFDTYNKVNKAQRNIAKSPRVLELARKAERRMDRSFGNDMVGQKPLIATKVTVSSLGRFDYGAGDYGTRMTLASAAQNGYSGAGLRVGDIVEPTKSTSPIKGQYLKVVALTDATHIRLEDVAALAFAGTKEKTTVTTVADVAGSLNSKFFLLSKPGTNYYVWYNINGAGVDPAVGGRTGIMVAAATGTSATAIATATKAALDAVAGAWTTAAVGSTLTITDQAVGTATDAADGSAPTSFAITVVTQGAAANPTPTADTNVTVRMQVSTVKASYV